VCQKDLQDSAVSREERLLERVRDTTFEGKTQDESRIASQLTQMEDKLRTEIREIKEESLRRLATQQQLHDKSKSEAVALNVEVSKRRGNEEEMRRK
jgi:hypothetical protein